MTTKSQRTVSVRITERRYQRVKASAEQHGHTISWLMNYLIDMYFQENPEAAVRQKDKKG